MKPRQRQAAILEYLQKQGKCSVEELAQYFDTTGTTIRKDLVILEHAGTVIRTYGGVVLNKEESDPPIDHKTLINTHKKELIAEAAVSFIHDGDSIILDAGSTVLQMVPLLSRFNNITVMTNSLHIVNALSELDNEQTILMPGGTFRKKSASFHGQLAENAFEHFTFDKLFMGTDGIDLNAGVTTFNEVYTVSKAMCNAAREVILMADSSKFGRKSPNVVCSLESVDKLITDAGIDPAFRQALEEKGSTVLQMVPLLSRFNNITVMTNSLHIVNALSELDNEQTILMPGGTFRKKSASFHGQLAENAFEHFTFDKLFMGTDGIDLNAGVTTFNEVYTVSKAMCNAAREVILMADSSKFGRKSPNVVCSLESVDKLITDAGIDPAFRQALEEKGIDVIITGESNE